MTRFRSIFLTLAGLGLAACTTLSGGGGLPPPPVHVTGGALWMVVHDQCVPDQRAKESPSPCTLVWLTDGEAHGFVVLKDRAGMSQHLVMPTAKITGIEDAQLLAPEATNYFAKAWAQRHFVEEKLGGPVDRSLMAVTVNSPYGRSQDQLHLHIDCLDASVATALKAAHPTAGWEDASITLKGRPYHIRWLPEAALGVTNPFKLLANTMPGARSYMAAWTLALAGATDKDGQPGFWLLADRANPGAGDPASAEDLQDHSCAVAALKTAG